MLGFAELGLLPAPPEPKEQADDASEAAEGAEAKLFPYLANLAVQAGARRLGLGKALVVASERQAAEFGFDRMYIKVERGNLDARRLYDKLGYRMVYLQPAGWTPQTGPTDTNLFLRKDGIGSGKSE